MSLSGRFCVCANKKEQIIEGRRNNGCWDNYVLVLETGLRLNSTFGTKTAAAFLPPDVMRIRRILTVSVNFGPRERTTHYKAMRNCRFRITRRRV